MAENTSIGWCDHTANPFWGCTKRHQGCTNCYALAWDKRHGGNHWGSTSPRRAIQSCWTDLAKWQRNAAKNNEFKKVFVSSMCDIFEDYDGPVVDAKGSVIPGLRIVHLRDRIMEEMMHCPNLIFLMLTKRPENIWKMALPVWKNPGRWPFNVWTGTSPCDQETAELSIPHLLKVPGQHFLSCEPLLGRVDLTQWLWGKNKPCEDCPKDVDCVHGYETRASILGESAINWVIVGGESVGGRECHIEYIRQIVDDCKRSKTPVFVKQLGSNPVQTVRGPTDEYDTVELTIKSRKGDDINEWPPGLRIQEFPNFVLSIE